MRAKGGAGAVRESAYHLLAQELRAAILRHEYPDGVRLPTEAELAEQHRVSRQTVRRAFQDLVSDRAGQRFGTIAMNAPQKLQRALVPGIKDSDFLPPFADLEDELTEPEFKRRYGTIGSGRYNTVVADIDSRIAKTPLLR